MRFQSGVHLSCRQGNRFHLQLRQSPRLYFVPSCTFHWSNSQTIWTRISFKNSFIPLEGSFVPSRFPLKLTRYNLWILYRTLTGCCLPSSVASHVTNSDCRPFDSFILIPRDRMGEQMCGSLSSRCAHGRTISGRRSDSSARPSMNGMCDSAR